MRSCKHRNELSVKKECLEKFPNGNISINDRENNRGLFLWMDRNMEGFRKAYKYIYDREYIDKRTIIDKNGKNNGRYIDGRHPLRLKLRGTKRYKEWRLMVFGRDDFTCQECGKRGCYLEAHHKKCFALYPKLRFDVKNGITYCKKCHIFMDVYRGKRGGSHQKLRKHL